MKARILVAVAVGGAVGAVARAALTIALPDPTGGFPWTTFAINVTGSFLLALLPAFAVVRRSELLPPLLGTGVMGGYTTLSAYSEQTRALLDLGRTGTATAYFVGTIAACLVVVQLADLLSTRSQRRTFDDEEGDL